MAGRDARAEGAAGSAPAWSAAQTILPGKPFTPPAGSAAPQPRQEVAPAFAPVEEPVLAAVTAAPVGVAAPAAAVPVGAAPVAAVPVGAASVGELPPIALMTATTAPAAPSYAGTGTLPPPPPAPPSAPPADAAVAETADTSGSSARSRLLVIALVVVALVAGGGYWFFLRPSNDTPVEQTISVPVPVRHHVGPMPTAISGFTRVQGKQVDALLASLQTPMTKAGFGHVIGGAYQRGAAAADGFFVVTTDSIPTSAGDVASAFASNFVASERAHGVTVTAPVRVSPGTMHGQVLCGSGTGKSRPLSYCLWYDRSTMGLLLTPSASAQHLEPAVRAAIEH